MAEVKKFMTVGELREAGARAIGPNIVVLDADGMAHSYSDNKSHGASIRDGKVVWAWIASYQATAETIESLAKLKAL